MHRDDTGNGDPPSDPEEDMPLSGEQAPEAANPDSDAYSEFGLNAAFLGEIRDDYRVDPDSVAPGWSSVFDGAAPQARRCVRDSRRMDVTTKSARGAAQ